MTHCVVVWMLSTVPFSFFSFSLTLSAKDMVLGATKWREAGGGATLGAAGDGTKRSNRRVSHPPTARPGRGRRRDGVATRAREAHAL